MKISDSEWLEAQKFETNWWRGCGNTYTEETKQLVYARRMGLLPYTYDGHTVIEVGNKTILDIGGGPSSLLLKVKDLKFGWVIDPMPMPDWVELRYRGSGIRFLPIAGEDFDKEVFEESFDEVWIYNVLQHTQDPEKIISNAKKAGKLIRIFEWVNTPPHAGHPHTLKEAELNLWLGGSGRVENMQEAPEEKDRLLGTAYYGVFPTPLADKEPLR